MRLIKIAAEGSIVEEGRALTDFIAGNLEKIRTDASGWHVLYRDRSNADFCEPTYPHGEMHGGGPRLLTCLGHTLPDQWREKRSPGGMTDDEV